MRSGKEQDIWGEEGPCAMYLFVSNVSIFGYCLPCCFKRVLGTQLTAAPVVGVLCGIVFNALHLKLRGHKFKLLRISPSAS